jgi:hypothetical protein
VTFSDELANAFGDDVRANDLEPLTLVCAHHDLAADAGLLQK